MILVFVLFVTIYSTHYLSHFVTLSWTHNIHLTQYFFLVFVTNEVGPTNISTFAHAQQGCYSKNFPNFNLHYIFKEAVTFKSFGRIVQW